jgi:hypothetical protein
MSVPIGTILGFGPQLSTSMNRVRPMVPWASVGPLHFCHSRKTDKGLAKYCEAVESNVFIL